MRVLVVGATGFIGSAIYRALKDRGFSVVAALREPKKFDGEAIEIDFTDIDELKLSKELEGFDVVVNSVGIIAQKGKQSFELMHTTAPIKLFKAAKEAGVSKIIQISALGAKSGTTAYHKSKNIADNYLRELNIDYAILYPSVVYGDDGKSTALFEALASLPIVPIIEDGSQQMQPIDVKDLANTVIKAIESKEKNIELNLVGEKPISYKNLLLGFKRYLGLKSSKTLSIPNIGTDIVGKILDEPTINSDSIVMLNQGNSASVEPLSKFLNYTPISIEDNLFKKSASNAKKLYASLYFIRPLLRYIIGFVWIWSGIVSSFLYPQSEALKLLNEVGISAPFDLPLLYISSFLDIAIGVATIIRFRLKELLIFQIVVIFVYTVILSLFAPYHWLHPFGPVLKNLPLIVAIYILLLLERHR